MADDLNFEDFDDLDLGDSDPDSKEDDLDLGSDDLDLESGDLDDGDLDLEGDDLDLENNDLEGGDLDLEEDDLDLEEDDLETDDELNFDNLADDDDLASDEVLDDEQDLDEVDQDTEDTDLVDPEEMSLEGDDFDLVDPDEDDESIDDQDLEEALEEDFDLEDEDSTAPEPEMASEMDSTNELESELSDLEMDEDTTRTGELGADLYNELSADEPEGVVLDESMEILDMEMGRQITPLNVESNEPERDFLVADQDNANIPSDNMATSNVIKFNNPSEFDLTKSTHSTQQFKRPEVSETSFSSKVSNQKQVLGNDLLFNLPHQLTVQVGNAHLKGAEISSLTYGSVIELDRNIGEPVDIVLGDVTIAKGEVVQINDEKLGVRITRINC
jgi:flagellar motor switch protein FliN